MQRILITGTNRGLGLELVAQYAEAGERVFATCRRPDDAADLQALAQKHANITILGLDLADNTQFKGLVATLSAQIEGLDVVIHNAGMNPRTPQARWFGDLTAEAIQDQMQTNAIGPLLLTQALLPLLRRGPIVVMVSSQMGSLQWKQKGGGYAYSMSKAAMNMAARTLAYELRPQGIRVIALHPGWVITDMGGESAELTPQESARSIRALLGKVSLEDSGSFYKWDGTPHVW